MTVMHYELNGSPCFRGIQLWYKKLKMKTSKTFKKHTQACRKQNKLVLNNNYNKYYNNML